MENTTIAILGKPAEEKQLDWVEQLHPNTGGSQSEKIGGLNNE